MNTEKIYYLDSYTKDFTATVMSCIEKNGKFEIILDKTAFFPEGGGQSSDTGYIDTARVTDVQEENGTIIHYADSVVKQGSSVCCKIDWDDRFRKMQNHSGEHIISGTVHRLYGYNNVGFHLGSEDVTLDFDGALTRDDLNKIEYIANGVAAKNVEIRAYFPNSDELSSTDYRSKLDLTENVRLVEIKDCDVCACCAPHVKRTGEIGIIKILDFEKYKGGVRCHMLCGFDALSDYNEKYGNVLKISSLLSAKQENTAAAVEGMLKEIETLKKELVAVNGELVHMVTSSLKETDGNICVFVGKCGFDGLREIVNCGMTLCNGMCAAFSGDDVTGYNYIIGSQTINLREKTREINEKICARGGGSPTMIQGHSASTKENIINSFK